MADLRTASVSPVDTVSSAAPHHEEQATSPGSQRALLHPGGLSPLRGASTSGSQEAHVPAQPRVRTKPPSHRHELAKDGLPETTSLHDLEDSRHFAREFQRRDLKMAKRAARTYSADGHAMDRSESYDTKHKRFWKDKSGSNQGFSRRAASHLDEEFSPMQAFAKGEGSTFRSAGKNHTNVAKALGVRPSREAADASTSRAAELPSRPPRTVT